MIQNLLKYYSFVKDRIFQHLLAIFSKKMQAQATYCRTLSDLIMEVENKLKHIHQHAKERDEPHQELNAYAQVFDSVKQQLRAQLQQIQSSQQQHEQAYIYILQSCKMSHIDSQKQVLDYVQKELSNEAFEISHKVDEIEKKQREIDGIKVDCFRHMLQILNDFDEDVIREKYNLTQSQKNFKFLGSKRKEMNEKLDEISALEQEMKQKTRQIRQIEKSRSQFMLKVSDKLDSIERAKLCSLQQICYLFRAQFRPIQHQIDYKKAVSVNRIQDPYSPNRPFLESYKNCLYLLLNPHPPNKMLIDHRQSLASKLSLSNIKDNRNAQVFEALSFDFEVDNRKEEENSYNGYVEFLNRIRSTVASAYLSEEQLKAFYDYFKGCLRKKALREVFLFYLYELGRLNSAMLGLIHKEREVLIHMIVLFLGQCLSYYDSQSAIKTLMLVYHIDLPDPPELYQVVRSHPLWRSFEFWETSFLQSAYEYFEMVVIYYHKLVEAQSQRPSTQQNSNWFTNIFKIWKFPAIEKKKMSPQDSLKQFYHQIIQNLSLIYMSNMIMMLVPHHIVDKFKQYILQSTIKLNWSTEFVQHLQTLMEIVSKRTEKNIKKLLRNDNVLEKIMSKLIGSSEEEKESVPLSKSINDWLQSK